MRIYNTLEEFPKYEHLVMTLGTFDGWHQGHRKILDAIKNYSEKNQDCQSVVITFKKHPLKLLNPEKAPKMLNNLEFKIDFVDKQGIDHLIIIDFSQNFANITHNQFVDILLSKADQLHLIVGFDLMFGKGNKGDINYLKQQAQQNPHLSVEIIEKVEYHGQKICSSCIRELIQKGEVKRAAYFLEREYFIEGEVITGEKLGAKIGFPTLNLASIDFVIPKTGVYKTQTEIDGEKYNSMTFVGTKSKELKTPYAKMQVPLIETNVFNWDKELYGKTIKVYFQEFIREKVQFHSMEELKEQLKRDKEECLK